MTDDDLVTSFDTEGRGSVDWEVLVALLVSVVLWNVVKVFSTDDDSSGHLGRNDLSGQDTASDGDFTGPWALLVDVSAGDSLLRSLEA